MSFLQVSNARSDVARAAEIAALMVVSAAMVAAGVRAFAPDAVRSWLDLPFGGVPPELDQVLKVFANNVRLLGGLIAGALLGQLALRNAAGGMRVLAFVCDAIIVLVCANEVFLVGATVGAYGSRGVGAVLPHGPFELFAYSLGLSLYVAARRERLTPSRAIALGTLSVAVLAVAAVLEVMA
jgi:hypothetical protein